MRDRSEVIRLVLLAICIYVTQNAWAGETPSDKSKVILIDISGSDNTQYKFAWTVTGNNGERQRFEEVGRVPTHYAYDGQAIAGEIIVLSEPGQLQVEIRRKGNYSRSVTQGKGSVLRIRFQ